MRRGGERSGDSSGKPASRPTPEQFRRVRTIFLQAVEFDDPEARKQYLEDACSGDEELAGEVESLIRADQEAGDFIEHPAITQVAENLAHERLSLMLGKKIGRYQCLELLGAGGMGEVFLAADPTLNRNVALKVLSEQFLQDPYRIRRFRREALAASALNHPNILTIHEIGEIDGLPFMVTELVEGETLRLRIEAGIRLPEAMEVAGQMCSALDSAHRAGIVHRDLKPENVMVRPDGLVKILDFGLATLAPGVGAEDFRSEPGSGVEGTLDYMSPEQLLGEESGPATDIYSLGVILCEMITGQVLPGSFERNPNRESTVSRASHSIPDLPPDTPPRLVSILERTLQENPETRYASVGELRDDLLAVDLRQPDRAEGVPGHAGRRPWILIPFLAGLAFLLFWSWRGSTGPLVITDQLSEANFRQITRDPAIELYPNLSPDGRTLFYASDARGNWDVYRRPLGENTVVNLTADCLEDDRSPAVSPDGSLIVFRSEREGGGIFLMTEEGRDVRRLTRDGHNPAWSFDGRQIAFTEAESLEPSMRGAFPSALDVLDIVTGERRRIDATDASQVSWSPNGFRLAYWGIHQGGQRDIWTVSPEGGPAKPLTNDSAIDWNPVWSPDGRFVYFASDRAGQMNLWRIRLNERTGEALSDAEPVTIPAVSSWYLSFSRDGRHLVYVQAINRTNIAEVDFDANEGRVVGERRWRTRGTRLSTNPHLSSDGRWMVYDSVGDIQEDLYVLGEGEEDLVRITNDRYRDRAPRWHPDGETILFFSDRSGRYDLWTIKRDGTDLRQLRATTGAGAQVSLWSPGGSSVFSNRQSGEPLLFSRSPETGEWQSTHMASAPMAGDLFWDWSPDGELLAGFGSGIFTYQFRTGHSRRLTDYGDRPVWLSDSRRLLFFWRERLYLLDTVTEQVREVLSVEPFRFQSLGVSSDSRRVYFSLASVEADIWMASLDE